MSRIATGPWAPSKRTRLRKRRDFLTKLAHPTADFFAMKGVQPDELRYFIEQIENFYAILTKER